MTPAGFTPDQAWSAVEQMLAIAVAVMPSPRVCVSARPLMDAHSLSFWDALLVVACIEAGAQPRYTEDMGATRQIESLQRANPFA